MEGAESADGLACVGIIMGGVEVLHDLDNIANVLAICLASCTHWTAEGAGRKILFCSIFT